MTIPSIAKRGVEKYENTGAPRATIGILVLTPVYVPREWKRYCIRNVLTSQSFWRGEMHRLGKNINEQSCFVGVTVLKDDQCHTQSTPHAGTV